MDKQHILNEIKRTAAANSGTPLGSRSFAKETGVKDTDWLGRYWARWSDAVKEAGLTPNERQGAFAVDNIIENVITLAREHGRIPFKSELKMRAYEDKSFPGMHTIYKRLGNSKPERAKKIQEYCLAKGGYSDIIAMCDIVLAEENTPKTTLPGIKDRNGVCVSRKVGEVLQNWPQHLSWPARTSAGNSVAGKD